MNLIKRVLRQRHVNWALADQALVSAVNFLTGVLLARYLGIVEFGIFTLAWLTVELTHNVQFSLIIGPLVSILPKQAEAERPAYVMGVVAQQTAFAMLGFALFWIGLHVLEWVSPESEFSGFALPLAVVVFTCQMQNFVRRYLFTTGGVIAAFFVDVVRYGGQIVLLVCLSMLMKWNTVQVLWMIASTAAASAALGVFFFETLTWRPEAFRQALVRHWHFAKWLFGSEIMRWVSGNFYAMIAGAIIGPAAVGAVRATQNLVALCNIILLGLENVVPVTASRRLHEGGTAALFDYLRKVGWVGGVAVGAVILVVVVAPEFWLDLIYAHGYSGYGSLVWWWGFIYLITYVGILGNVGLRAYEETKPIFWGFLASTVFTVVMVYPMVSYFGITGVMAGYACVNTIQLVFFYYGLWGRAAAPA